MQRVMVFIDGFNLYHGLKDRYGRKYHWLDLQRLATSLLKNHQVLVKVKYFTARVRNSPAGLQRQSDYLDALEAHCDKVEVISGRFQEKYRSCSRCGARWVGYEEKETDVSIAVALLEHGVNGDFDVALIVSGDSDLCPAVRALGRLRPDKRVIAVFPPARWSADIKATVHAAFQLGHANIRQSQLPEAVTSKAGLTLKRPAHWR
jgi:uncharacterized LabA/DUF88 family protein